jgi:hypothetical protein
LLSIITQSRPGGAVCFSWIAAVLHGIIFGAVPPELNDRLNECRMEKINTLLRSACLIMLAIGVFSGCSKTAAEPEIPGPKETVVLNLVDVQDQKVGSLFIDNMNGKAQARISMDSGYYYTDANMKANITLSTPDGTVLYAHCTDVNSKDGKCSTFPITVLKDNSDALFRAITTTSGIVFNVMDKNNNVFAKSVKHTIVIDN